MGKVKKEKLEETADTIEVSVKEEDTYDDKVQRCSIIAKPMAPKKLTKKCLKLIKKGKSKMQPLKQDNYVILCVFSR